MTAKELSWAGSTPDALDEPLPPLEDHQRPHVGLPHAVPAAYQGLPPVQGVVQGLEGASPATACDPLRGGMGGVGTRVRQPAADGGEVAEAVLAAGEPDLLVVVAEGAQARAGAGAVGQVPRGSSESTAASASSPRLSSGNAAA